MKQLFHVKAFSIKSIVAIIATSIFFSSCSEETVYIPEPFPAANDVAQYEATDATDWINLELTAVKATPGYTPPVAARTYGYTGIALWESVAQGIPNATSLSGQVQGLGAMPKIQQGKQYHWALVANSCMAETMRLFFPTAPDSIKNRIAALEEKHVNERKQLGIQTETIARSVAFGVSIAKTVFDYAKTDGGHEGYAKNFPSDFVVPKGEGLWVPTPPQMRPIPLQPYWGKNRPFVLKMGNPLDGCDPGKPIEFSKEKNSEFYKEAEEVYTTVKRITPQQREIALFWADDAGVTATPPGHSMSICSQLLTEKSKSLDFAARAFAMVGISVNEAFIACWDCKYKYNVIRPISYIQLYIDSSWNKTSITDPLITPPFPEYTSGHSSQGGAAFTVMQSLFGNIEFVDRTHINRGFGARYFRTMEAALQENAISRLYGGIHYRAAIDRGVTMGKDIGKAVVQKLRFTK